MDKSKRKISDKYKDYYKLCIRCSPPPHYVPLLYEQMPFTYKCPKCGRTWLETEYE